MKTLKETTEPIYIVKWQSKFQDGMVQGKRAAANFSILDLRSFQIRNCMNMYL